MGLGLGLDGPLNASLLRAPLCGANNDDDTSDHNEDDGEDVGDDDSDNDNDDDGEDGGLFSATSRRMNHKTASLLTTQVEYIIISIITFVIIIIIITAVVITIIIILVILVIMGIIIISIGGSIRGNMQLSNLFSAEFRN